MKAFEDFDPSLLKALFSQLVAAVGTQEAAAAYLGVSRQRVGQMITSQPPYSNDVPTWAQVFRLEQACKQSIIFGALARMVEGPAASDAMQTSIECSIAAASALEATADMRRDGLDEPHEVKATQERARDALAAAQRHYDATMLIRPGLRAVS